MTKQEAILEMRKGVKITHVNFSPDEWMTMQGLNIILEDGVKINAEQDFWPYRTGSGWDDGYSVFKEVTATMPDKKLTPMMELIEKLNQQKRILKEGFVEGKWNDDRCSEIDNCIQLAQNQLEKERKMVIDAFDKGNNQEFEDPEFWVNGKEYYTQTYKS